MEHPDHGVLYVGVSVRSGGPVLSQRLVDTGRRIAANVRIPGNTRVTPLFGFRDLPNDLEVRAFALEFASELRQVPSTGYDLGTCDTMPSIHVTTTGGDAPRGAPGRSVRGHETRYFDDAGHHKLWVLDAVDGSPVLTMDPVPPAELYAVAEPPAATSAASSTCSASVQPQPSATPTPSTTPP